MNEKLKYLNEERLSLSVRPRTITDCEVQQPLEIDSLFCAAMQTEFAAIKNAATPHINKIVLGLNTTKIPQFFISKKHKKKSHQLNHATVGAHSIIDGFSISCF
jgi:hypothetical protein